MIRIRPAAERRSRPLFRLTVSMVVSLVTFVALATTGGGETVSRLIDAVQVSAYESVQR